MYTNPYSIERCDTWDNQVTYFLHYTKEMVNEVNRLIKEGYNQKDACQKVLTQFRAESEKSESSAVPKNSGSLN